MVGCICDKICKFVYERLSGNTVYNSLSRLQRLGKAYQEKLGKNHVGAGETGESEPVSIVFNTSFQHAYTTSLYTLWLGNFDNFMSTLTLISLASTCASHI